MSSHIYEDPDLTQRDFDLYETLDLRTDEQLDLSTQQRGKYLILTSITPKKTLMLFINYKKS